VVHRTPLHSDQLLDHLRQRHRHRPPSDPRRLEAMPLGEPPESLPMNASITYWRTL
jgi:hypothetical protein